jgi:hypothetical protein
MRVNFNEITASTINFNINYIEVQDIPIAMGGQGEVYKSIDGKFAVKILFNDIPDPKIEKIIKKFSQKFMNGEINFNTPGFLAFPLLSFKTYLNGKEVRGTLAHYLPENQYLSLDQALNTVIQNWNLRQKIQLCGQIAQFFDKIQSIGYVYVDVSWENIKISRDGKVAFLDFESGGFLDTPDAEPATLGKTEGFEAPELALSPQPNISVATDWWAMAVLFFIILTGYHPFTFIDSISTAREYVKSVKWPNFHPKFCNNNYSEFNYILKSIDQSLIKLFEKTFNDGFEIPSSRVTPFIWLQTFNNLFNPKFVELTPKSKFISKDKKLISLYWKTDNIKFIIIKEIHPTKLFPPSGKFTLITDKKINQLTLIAIPKQGHQKEITQTVEI